MRCFRPWVGTGSPVASHLPGFKKVLFEAGKKPILEYVAFGYKWVVPKVRGLRPEGGPLLSQLLLRALQGRVISHLITFHPQ